MTPRHTCETPPSLPWPLHLAEQIEEYLLPAKIADAAWATLQLRRNKVEVSSIHACMTVAGGAVRFVNRVPGGWMLRPVRRRRETCQTFDLTMPLSGF